MKSSTALAHPTDPPFIRPLLLAAPGPAARASAASRPVPGTAVPTRWRSLSYGSTLISSGGALPLRGSDRDSPAAAMAEDGEECGCLSVRRSCQG